MNPTVAENPTTWQELQSVLRPLHQALQNHFDAQEAKSRREQKNGVQLTTSEITIEERKLDAKAAQEGGYQLADLVKEDVRQENDFLPEIETFINLLASTGDTDFSWIDENESLSGIHARLNNALNYIDDAVHLKTVLGQPSTDFSTAINLLLVEFWNRCGQINALWTFAQFGKKLPPAPDYTTAAEPGGLNWWYLHRFAHALYVTADRKNEKREEEEFGDENKLEGIDRMFDDNLDYDDEENDAADAWKRDGEPRMSIYESDDNFENEENDDYDDNEEDEEDLRDPVTVRYTDPWAERVINPEPEELARIYGFYSSLETELTKRPSIRLARKEWATTLDSFSSQELYRAYLQVSNASWVIESAAHLPELLRPEFSQPPADTLKVLLGEHWDKETLPEFRRFMKDIRLEN